MQAASADHLRLIKQLESVADLTEDSRTAIIALTLRTRAISAEREILREGSRATECCLILDGAACRYKFVAGGRRQILSLHIAGDMPDLQALHLDTMDHTLASVTAVRAAFITHEAIRGLMRLHPNLGDALMKRILIDAAIFREWIANVGRRTAIERIAHVICEVFVRMRAVGLAHAETFELPLTQQEIGDATGLSNVHVNRTLKELRRLGLIQTNGRVHSILDWEGLQETADFDPAYLHLRRLTPA